ncbi:MAG: hypothetical protein C4520_04405 [Candidatus Abyssobacteria bacterium SURF_5]|uniref:PhnA-like protein n=1 Tax=Abyssobacteria bacterium (strain SURF_5) TaxID=2093360 RepID=A0A3A4NZH4_ABYX5|nr:MAG: hypothetical protein C4520_04405 [Candidatus Abyssubacteria bacterium SURF_5]
MKEDIRGVPVGILSRISWGAIFAGAVVAVVVQLTLITLGLAIGFATIDPASEQNPFGGLGIGSAIWWIVSSIIALFAGGWVAGRLAGLQRIFDAALHGIITWGLVILLSAYFITSAVGAIIGGGFGMIGSVLSGSGQAVTALLPADVSGEIQEIVGAQENQQFARNLYSAVGDMARGGATQQERERVVALLEQNTGMSRQEAEDFVRRTETTLQEAEPQMRQAAENVAGGISRAALASFIMLVLTGAAAGFGGVVGRTRGPGEKIIFRRRQKAA